MRSFGILCLFLALIMVATPLISLSSEISFDSKFSNFSEKIQDYNGQADKSPKKSKKKKQKNNVNTFKVLLGDNKTVIELSEFDYICGAVACEMPAIYHEEALKAQAIACYTYAVKARNEQLKNPNPELNGAYISSDSSVHQGYKTKEELQEKWGDKYDTYYSKIQSAVKAVNKKVITYDDELITPAFHAISSGKTEDACIIWGGEVPYLVSVNSAGDRLSPDYSSTLVLSCEQFSSLVANLDGVTLSQDPASWVTQTTVSDAGTVTSITIGDKTFDGATVRKAFSLRSNCFNIEYKNNSFVFSVVGYGHGVGLSQYGADYMSRQGSKYDEILYHYYSGTKIKNLK